MVLLLFCNSLIFKFRFLLSLLQYLIERFLQKKAPGRGVAAEEFCVFGDWGVNPNKSEKPEHSGRVSANGAPYALLAKFALRKNFLNL